jgi:hypothetical protein
MMCREGRRAAGRRLGAGRGEERASRRGGGDARGPRGGGGSATDLARASSGSNAAASSPLRPLRERAARHRCVLRVKPAPMRFLGKRRALTRAPELREDCASYWTAAWGQKTERGDSEVGVLHKNLACSILTPRLVIVHCQCVLAWAARTAGPRTRAAAALPTRRASDRPSSSTMPSTHIVQCYAAARGSVNALLSAILTISRAALAPWSLACC